MFGACFRWIVVAAVLAGSSSLANASHFRGVDMWASIDANGVVKLTARTRWRKDFFAAIDPSRFTESVFTCSGTTTFSVSPATSLHITNVATGANVYEFPFNSFNYEATTVATDTTPAQYSERTQVLVIPLGSVAAGNEIVPPRNLPHGVYEISWNDWSRIAGIQNLPPSACDDNSGFGGRVRINFDGTASAGPSLTSTFITEVPRGFDYAQNLNATSPQGLALTYQLAAFNPHFPDYGSSTPVPGLALDATSGLISIPAASTATLLDNSVNPTSGADYMIHIEVTDSRGALSVRDGVLDAITSTNTPPTLDPIGDRVIHAGDTLTFDVTATDPDAGQTLNLRATGLPDGATFPATGGPNTGVTATFAWTPTDAQVGVSCLDFEAIDSGTAAASFIDTYTAQERVCITVKPAVRAHCNGGTVFADPNTCGSTASCSCENGTLAAQPTFTGTGAFSFSCTCSDGDSSATCTGTLDVVDQTAPAISCPANVAGECTGNRSATLSAGSAQASDACSVPAVTDPPVTSYALGTTVVVHTATDPSHNASSCTNTVMVIDTTPPALACPAGIVAECTGGQAATVAPAAATASDTCSSATVTPPPITSYPLGTTTVGYLAQDESGNTSVCTSTISVVDTTAPAIACPATVTAECTGGASAFVTPGAATASDVCSDVTVAGPLAGIYPLGDTQVTYTATDGSGNASSCAATIAVVDTTVPAIAIPTGASTQYVVGDCGGAALSVPTLPTAVDTCHGVVPVTCTTVAGTSFGPNAVTCTATDGSGNSSSVTLTLVVMQPLAVVFDPPLAGGGTAENRFTAGQTLVHKVRLLDCTQADVTETAPVTVSLDVELNEATGGGGAVEINDVPTTYNGVGDSGSRLVLVGGDYQYNLSTKGYQAGTANDAYFYQSQVSVVYQSVPALVVGSEVARLESK